MGFMALASIIYLILWAHFRRQNKKRDAGELDHTVQGMSDEEIQELGEHNPEYRYTY